MASGKWVGYILVVKNNYMLQLSHKDLQVYKIALQFLKEIYSVTDTFPKQEQFGLISQIRRAAVSVCSNIAEGASRKSKAEKRRFYEVSRSSLVEIDTQLEIAILLAFYKKEQNSSMEQNMLSVFRILSKMIDNLG